MVTKLSKIQYFVFIALVLGICGSIFQQELFTATTLAETSLILFSLSYLVSKYYASSVIKKYRDSNYNPTKRKKFFESVIVESTFHIVIPISLSLLYACTFLFFLKLLPIPFYRIAGTIINPVLDFNAKYIKYPIALLTVILGILTLTRYLSLTKYKSFKTISKYIVAPFKVLVVLTFFLAQDTGVSNNLLQYHFNSKPVVSEFVTFNANTNTNLKNQKIEEALTDYITYVVERLDEKTFQSEEDDTSNNIQFPDSYKLKLFVQQFPDLRTEVHNTIQSSSVYLTGNNSELVDAYETAIWEHTNQPQKSSNLYSEAFKKESSFFDNFISVIADQRKSINSNSLSENAEIIQELVGDFLGEILPINKLTDRIPIHTIIKDKAVDVLKDKIINSFYALITKDNVTKSDIVQLDNYIDNVLGESYKSSVKSIRNKFIVLSTYYAEMNKDATSTYLDALNRTADPSIVDYEKGLSQKKYFLQEAKEKSLADKETILENWKKQYPSATDERLELAFDNLINDYYQNDISEINGALANPENLKNYEYIRDQFSAGGIFFGVPITIYNNRIEVPERVCQEPYYPSLNNCPASILKDDIKLVEVVNDYLVITAGNKKYTSLFKISKNLLLDAYNYVYANDTYPVLIDGFYDNNEKEVFGYNKNIIHDKELVQTLYTSDKFIFQVLYDSISNADLKARFTNAISNYRKTRGDVSLSRIYDDKYYITITPQANFQINSHLEFSVVSKSKSDVATSRKYREMDNISAAFNANSNWLFNTYPYLKTLNTFATYQALFRSVPQKKVDLSDLILKR